MKKTIVLLLLGLLMLSGCTKKPEEVEPAVMDPATAQDEGSLGELRKEIREAGKSIGVGFLGYSDYEDGMEVKEYLSHYIYYDKDFIYDMEDTQYINDAGYGLYLLVPVDDGVSLAINNTITEEVIYRNEEGKPIVYHGVLTENYPEIEVTVVDKGNVYTFPLGVFVDNRMTDFDAYLNISDPAIVSRTTVDEQFLDGTFVAKYQDDDGYDLEAYLKMEYPSNEFELAVVIDGRTYYEYGWFYRYNMKADATGFNRDAFVFEFSDGVHNYKDGIYWCYNLPGQSDRFYLLRLAGDLFVSELSMNEMLFIKK